MESRNKTVPPIERQTLHQELMSRLKALILDGTLKPGSKIPEVALAVQFGVSRTPLREALRALAADGVVNLVPNKGAIVAMISEFEIQEILPIIGALEALAGEIVCRTASDAEIASFREIHLAMIRERDAGNEDAYQRYNRQFHNKLLDLSHNTMLQELHANMILRIRAARFTSPKSPEKWADAISDHEGIVAAIEARDALETSFKLKKHMVQTATGALQEYVSKVGNRS